VGFEPHVSLMANSRHAPGPVASRKASLERGIGYELGRDTERLADALKARRRRSPSRSPAATRGVEIGEVGAPSIPAYIDTRQGLLYARGERITATACRLPVKHHDCVRPIGAEGERPGACGTTT
jgi:hypothetical protein